MAAPDDGPVRLVELLGAISLATDMGTGQPRGHALRTSAVAVAIGQEMGLDAAVVADVRAVALLRFLGCTADAAETAAMTGGDDIGFLAAMAPVAMGRRPEMARRLVGTVGAGERPWRRAALVAGALSDPNGAKRSLSAHCEVASMLAERFGMSAEVRLGLAHGHEHWDGAGFPDGWEGEAVPVAVRVAVVARDADLWWRSGREAMEHVLRSRRGRAYDPSVVDACLSVAPAVLADLDSRDLWDATVGEAPADDVLGAIVGADRLERTLEAVGHFTDLKSSWSRGHSTRVADLVRAAGPLLGMGPDEVGRAGRAALVADVGRVGVANGVWDRSDPLGVDDWERIRTHTYLTERTFAYCPPLAGIGRLAGAHHERLDGSGYHRRARELDLAERLVAAADVVAAMGEDRPHRAALAPEEVARAAGAEGREGRLDTTVVAAVLTAAGVTADARPAARGRQWPAGLTDREVEVLRLITRGRTNKEVGAALYISAKTVGRHIENVYGKIGVGSRAAAAVFAMEHRLLEG